MTPTRRTNRTDVLDLARTMGIEKTKEKQHPKAVSHWKGRVHEE